MQEVSAPQIGRNIRWHRKQLKLSARAVGRYIGVSQQQINKYETGLNRIPADRLYMLACAMEIPVEKFFEPESTATINKTSEALKLRHTITEQIKDVSNPHRLDQISGIIAILTSHDGPDRGHGISG